MKKLKHGIEFTNDDRIKDLYVVRIIWFSLGLITAFLLTTLLFCETPI